MGRHIVLSIAIRPSVGDVKPGGPLDAFREEQAMSRHRVSPSPFVSSSSNTTQTLTHTVTLTSLPPIHYTDTRPTRNVACPSGAWIENRPHSTPSIRLARNPKRVVVQWVGVRTHTLYLDSFLWEVQDSKNWVFTYVSAQFTKLWVAFTR